VGRPFMTGQIHFTHEAEQHLHSLDEWIVEHSNSDVARRVVEAILDHIDSIVVFPHAGRARGDIRPGLRTTTFRKRTLIAYEVDESSDEIAVNILGIFAGGQNWEGHSPEVTGRNGR
jgi:toxin ParE1/3/4